MLEEADALGAAGTAKSTSLETCAGKMDGWSVGGSSVDGSSVDGPAPVMLTLADLEAGCATDEERRSCVERLASLERWRNMPDQSDEQKRILAMFERYIAERRAGDYMSMTTTDTVGRSRLVPVEELTPLVVGARIGVDFFGSDFIDLGFRFDSSVTFVSATFVTGSGNVVDAEPTVPIRRTDLDAQLALAPSDRNWPCQVYADAVRRSDEAVTR